MAFRKSPRLIAILILVFYTFIVLAININFRLKIGQPIFGKDIFGWAVFLKYNDGGIKCDDGSQCISGLCAVVEPEDENSFMGECIKYSASHSGSLYLQNGKIPVKNGLPISCFDCSGRHNYRPWTAFFIFPHIPLIFWAIFFLNLKLMKDKKN